MGYLVQYSFHHVRIPASQVTAALAAIHALYEPHQIEQWGTGLIYDRTTGITKKCYRGGDLPSAGGFATLIDALASWAIGAVEQADGSVEMVEYRADKVGDERVLFEAISPFVDPECRARIDAYQENHEHWRHVFVNGQHRAVPGKVVYADEHPELFDVIDL
ncbi:hypothetical protein LEP3755_66740 (plasmid) [Leptolyngbya sp. NIES-3755]|nr:hypothetical protein LEP3755_66740 [Leptolyngbya sp. NIES-3755]